MLPHTVSRRCRDGWEDINMAVGQAQPGLSIPSPSELAGGPVTPAVTPSAVTQMTDALRQGFLTADDIIQRTGKRAQLKEKADVLALTEQISPEAIRARRAQSQLGMAQAEAALPLVQPTADLQQQQLQAQVAYQKYPAAKLFDQYAPVLGLSEPMTPDKQIDWSAKASIGIQIAEHLRLQNEAKEKLANITTEKSADGTVISAFTKQGLPVNSTEVQKLENQSRSPFRAMTPGTSVTVTPVSVSPEVLPLSGTPETIAKWRAQLINEGVTDAVNMADAEVDQLIESRRQAQVAAQPPVIAARPVIEPAMIGQPVGGGFSLGPPKPSDKPAPHYTETQQKALTALARSLASENTLLNRQQQADPNFNPADVKSQLRMKAYKGGTTGQIAATLGQITTAERQYATASNAWIQGLLRAESGAAIAAKEQNWYENTFFPAVGDPPAIQQQKSNLRKAIEQTFEQVIQGKMTPEEYQTFRDTISSAAGGSTTPTPQGQTFEIQGVGKVFRGADGKMYRQ